MTQQCSSRLVKTSISLQNATACEKQHVKIISVMLIQSIIIVITRPKNVWKNS